jgi:molybdate transport system regulatory protein
MEPRSKLWVEKDGKLVLSAYRVRLLRLIDETGSLAEAAAKMDLSYRRAWGKLREIEDNLGLKLVERSKGGTGGGGSRLTPQGRSMIEQFERFRDAAERDVALEFASMFDDSAR